MTKYNNERLLGEYTNFIANSIYSMKKGSNEYHCTKFNDDGITMDISELDTRSALEHLNFLFPHEFNSLINGLNIDHIIFSNSRNYDRVSNVAINNRDNGSLLYIYPYSAHGRSYDFVSNNFHMAFNYSSWNSEGQEKTYLHISELTSDGLYVLKNSTVNFISIDDLKMLYEQIYANQYTFDDFLHILPYEDSSLVSDYRFKRINVPENDILFDKKIDSVNLIIRHGFVNYLKNNGYGLAKDVNYDNSPIYVDGYDNLRDEISHMKR